MITSPSDLESDVLPLHLKARLPKVHKCAFLSELETLFSPHIPVTHIVQKVGMFRLIRV